jgi:hypothetical protein
MNQHSLEIVADGLQRLRRAKKWRAVRARLLAEARIRRREELGGASTLRRIWLEWEIQREVHARMGELFPDSALFFTGVNR